MNSKILSLYSFDEQLGTWLGDPTGQKQEAQVFSPDKALKQLSTVWPFVLKLLADATLSPDIPAWLPLALLSADRLILASRKLPVHRQERKLEALTKEIAALETNSQEMVEKAIATEKASFYASYGRVESEVHKAVDYWPVWEAESRDRAIRELERRRQTLRSAQAKERDVLATLHAQQASLRDKWFSLRKRLWGENSSWWGRVSGQTSNEQEEWIDFDLLRLNPILDGSISGSGPPTPPLLQTLYQFITRLNIVSSLRLSDEASEPLWDALRLALGEIVQSAAVTYDPMLLCSMLNVIDALIGLLHAHDQEGLTLKISILSGRASNLQTEIAMMEKNAMAPSEDLILRDPVVSQFRADSRDRLAQAALSRVADAIRERMHKELSEKRVAFMAEVEGLNQLMQARTRSFEEPWGAVLGQWAMVRGGENRS